MGEESRIPVLAALDLGVTALGSIRKERQRAGYREQHEKELRGSQDAGGRRCCSLLELRLLLGFLYGWVLNVLRSCTGSFHFCSILVCSALFYSSRFYSIPFHFFSYLFSSLLFFSLLVLSFPFFSSLLSCLGSVRCVCFLVFLSNL